MSDRTPPGNGHDKRTTAGQRKQSGQRSTRWGDNVVMADFGSRRRAEHRAQQRGASGEDVGGGVRQRATERESWAASVLMEAIASGTDSGRLARGREYYRADRVVSLELDTNVAAAFVSGTQLEPFSVTIRLSPLGQKARAELFGEFVSDTSHVRSLLAGSAPGLELADRLFSAQHVSRVTCTCPDKTPICKHVVAVAYAVAERMTEDPMRIIRWRGLDPDAILQPLRDYNGPGVVPLTTGLLGRVSDDSARNGDPAGATGTGSAGSSVTEISSHSGDASALSLSDSEPDLVDQKDFWGDPDARVTWSPLAPESGLEKGRRQDLMNALRGVSWSTVDQVKTLHELELCYEDLMDAEPLFEYPAASEQPLSTRAATTEEDSSNSDRNNNSDHSDHSTDVESDDPEEDHR